MVGLSTRVGELHVYCIWPLSYRFSMYLYVFIDLVCIYVPKWLVFTGLVAHMYVELKLMVSDKPFSDPFQQSTYD